MMLESSRRIGAHPNFFQSRIEPATGLCAALAEMIPGSANEPNGKMDRQPDRYRQVAFQCLEQFGTQLDEIQLLDLYEI